MNFIRGSLFSLAFIFINTACADEDIFSLSLEELVEIEVTSASLFKESLADVPVPITVITAQMIDETGARNLKDLLTTFVPNFTSVEDQNEQNVAARGVFTSSQQKILIMIEGHRLNSRSYSIAAPDYGISLDKIKQIEVLRGPASSLYGNVALTATINIILKKGSELDSTLVTLGLAKNNTQQVNFLHGQTIADLDLLAWGQYFKSEGDTINIPNSPIYLSKTSQSDSAIIGGYDDLPSYDIGAKIKDDNWSLYANWRRGHYIEPFSGGGKTGEPYDYDDYAKLNGIGPGLGWQSQHYNFSFDKQLNNWLWHQEIYLDENEINSLVVVNPETKTYSAPSWRERSVGLISSINKQTQNANYLIGFQYDAMKIKDSELLTSFEGSDLLPIEGIADLLPKAKESIASIFVQMKYRLNDLWLANIGARYDYKSRYETEYIEDFSPRLSLVYNKNEQFNLKLSYASSFVDATFWNRFSTLPSFQGSENLKPERLESIQLTPTFTLLDQNLILSTNIYYNELSDFIFRDNNPDILGPNYINAGELKSWGVEFEGQYQHKDVSLKVVVGYQKAISSENYGETDGDVHNVPSLTANFISTIAVSPNSDFNLIIRYIGSQTSPIFMEGEVNAKEYSVDPALVLNANYQHQITSDFNIEFNLHNVLDHQYEQGGTTVHPYPQQGRSAKVSLSYKF